MENKETKSILLIGNERASWGAFVFWLLGVVVLIAIDQCTKIIAFYSHGFSILNNLQPIIGKELFLNDKFAFSLPVPVGIMYVIYAVIMTFIFVYIARNFFTTSNMQRFGWALIIAGAISNIGERLYYGFVKDFIYILSGIFNVADLFIILGIMLLLFFSKRSALNAKR